MVKIGFIADVHIGNHRLAGGPLVSGLNLRCRSVLWALENAYQKASELGCGYMVILGDLFDTARPLPQEIAQVQYIIRSFPKIETVVLLGNHEMCSTAPGDHALGVLEPVALVVDKPSAINFGGDFQLLAVPFQPGPAKEWFPDALNALPLAGDGRPIILTFHLGVEDGETPAYLQGARDSIHLAQLAPLMMEKGLRWAFCGNWHERKQWARETVISKGLRAPLSDKLCDPPFVHQVGTLSPTGWDNPGFDDHGFLVTLDLEGSLSTISEYSIPGPRFIKLVEVGALPRALERAAEGGHRLFVKSFVSEHLREEVEGYFLKLVEEEKVMGWVIDPSRAASREAAAQAAQAARSQETLAEAVVAFVDAMEIPKGITKERVLELARGYLQL